MFIRASLIASICVFSVYVFFEKRNHLHTVRHTNERNKIAHNSRMVFCFVVKVVSPDRLHLISLDRVMNIYRPVSIERLFFWLKAFNQTWQLQYDVDFVVGV